MAERCARQLTTFDGTRSRPERCASSRPGRTAWKHRFFRLTEKCPRVRLAGRWCGHRLHLTEK